MEKLVFAIFDVSGKALPSSWELLYNLRFFFHSPTGSNSLLDLFFEIVEL